MNGSLHRMHDVFHSQFTMNGSLHRMHDVFHSQFTMNGFLHRTTWCFTLSVHHQRFTIQNCMVFHTLSSPWTVLYTELHGVSHFQFTMNGSLHRTTWCFTLSVHHQRFTIQNCMVFHTFSSPSTVPRTSLHGISHSQFTMNGSLHRMHDVSDSQNA